MPTFVVELANRHNGRAHSERVIAANRSDVARHVDTDNYLIGEIRDETTLAPAGGMRAQERAAEDVVFSALDRADKLRRRRDSTRSVLIVLGLIVAAVVIVAAGIAWSVNTL